VNTPARGRLITFEGIDGSGKTTAAVAAACFLRSQGIEVVMTRQPGGTELGEKLREILKHHPSNGDMDGLGEILLLCASFRASCLQEIGPALEQGKWVICDRFTDSTLAYQCGGRGVDAQEAGEILKGCVPETPDLTIYYDVPPEKGLSRTQQRSKAEGGGGGGGRTKATDNFEKGGAAFQAKVRSFYQTLAHEESDRIRTIDTEAKSIEETIEATIEILQEHLRKHTT
jgi:dTMP kinase